MHRFKRHGRTISTDLDPDEVRLLQSLLSELIGLVGPDNPLPAVEDGDDPFAALAADFGDDQPVQPPQDPVLRRLLPDAYPGDAKASQEFRRFTDRDLRQKKVDDAEVVLRHLESTDEGRRDVRIPVEEAEAWLRALTSLRLAVAGRLGIADNTSADEIADLAQDDPRAFLVSVYDWLGFAQETLVSAL